VLQIPFWVVTLRVLAAAFSPIAHCCAKLLALTWAMGVLDFNDNMVNIGNLATSLSS
jgi:hypothetical protein